jgi:hypothetical protein
MFSNSAGQYWRADTHVFEAYTSGNRPKYSVAASDASEAPGEFIGTVPANLPTGAYFLTAYQNAGGVAGSTENGSDTLLASGQYIGSGAVEATPLIDSAGVGDNAVTVTVTDGTNPIAGAIVRFTLNSNESYWLATGSDGKAIFALEAGTWTLTISKGGYVYSGTTQPISVNPTSIGAVMTPVTIPTQSDPAKLTGVGLIHGNSVANVKVYYRLVNPPPGATGFWDFTTQTTSSDGSGNISVGLYLGAEYQFWMSDTSEKVSVVVPTSGTSMTLPMIRSAQTP